MRDIEFAPLLKKIAEQRAEIERLRKALKQIADDSGGCPAEDVVDELQKAARGALIKVEQP